MTNNTINNSLQNLHADDKQQQIIELFFVNVKGKEICLDNQNIKHCGKEGHWLETQMGIKLKKYLLGNHLHLSILLNVSKTTKLYLIVECMMETLVTIRNLEVHLFGMS